METDAQIAGENPRKYKYKFLPKVDEWLLFQSRKADSEEAILYDNEEWKYEVKSQEEPQTMAGNMEVGLSRCR